MKLEVASGVGDGGGAAAACRSIFAFRFFLIVCAMCVFLLFFKLSQFYLHRRYALNALCICICMIFFCFVFSSFVFLSYFECAVATTLLLRELRLHIMAEGTNERDRN